MSRLFLAIDPPDSVKEEVEGICRGLPGIRWTPQDQLHLTLRFIGEADEELQERIHDELSSVDFEPFDLRIRGIGQFLKEKRINVLWAGLETSEPLVRLQQDVEKALRRAGLKADKKPFQPHITLARPKNFTYSRIVEYLKQYGEFFTEPFTVEGFSLYSSVLRPGGALHTEEAYYIHTLPPDTGGDRNSGK